MRRYPRDEQRAHEARDQRERNAHQQHRQRIDLEDRAGRDSDDARIDERLPGRQRKRERRRGGGARGRRRPLQDAAPRPQQRERNRRGRNDARQQADRNGRRRRAPQRSRADRRRDAISRAGRFEHCGDDRPGQDGEARRLHGLGEAEAHRFTARTEPALRRELERKGSEQQRQECRQLRAPAQDDDQRERYGRNCGLIDFHARNRLCGGITLARECSAIGSPLVKRAQRPARRTFGRQPRLHAASRLVSRVASHRSPDRGMRPRPAVRRAAARRTGRRLRPCRRQAPGRADGREFLPGARRQPRPLAGARSLHVRLRRRYDAGADERPVRPPARRTRRRGVLAALSRHLRRRGGHPLHRGGRVQHGAGADGLDHVRATRRARRADVPRPRLRADRPPARLGARGRPARAPGPARGAGRADRRELRRRLRLSAAVLRAGGPRPDDTARAGAGATLSRRAGRARLRSPQRADRAASRYEISRAAARAAAARDHRGDPRRRPQITWCS